MQLGAKCRKLNLSSKLKFGDISYFQVESIVTCYGIDQKKVVVSQFIRNLSLDITVLMTDVDLNI